MAKPEFQPKITYNPALDQLSVINIENFTTLPGQRFDSNTIGFRNRKRWVGISVLRATHSLRNFMTANGLKSLADLPVALDKIGDEKNLSLRGATRLFINDVIYRSGFDDYKDGK